MTDILYIDIYCKVGSSIGKQHTVINKDKWNRSYFEIFFNNLLNREKSENVIKITAIAYKDGIKYSAGFESKYRDYKDMIEDTKQAVICTLLNIEPVNYLTEQILNENIETSELKC